MANRLFPVIKQCRVIYHSGFYLTELLILGCMLNLFSVVLFGLDGALISFESLQWVCKVTLRVCQYWYRHQACLLPDFILFKKYMFYWSTYHDHREPNNMLTCLDLRNLLLTKWRRLLTMTKIQGYIASPVWFVA